MFVSLDVHEILINFSLSSMIVYYSSSVIMSYDDDYHYNVDLDGILGFEFLSPLLFSINYKKQKLYLHQLKVINP